MSRTLVVLLLLILLLSSGAQVLDAYGFSEASETWWNSNWKHRRPITITNASNETLLEFQVRINVSYESEMRLDFADVRFIKDVSENLSHWKQSYAPGLTAVFWVKVPEIPANGVIKIFMYFGNSSAADEGSGDSVFEFFDDFGSGLKKWNLYGVPLPKTFQDPRFHDGWGYETGVQSTFRSGSWSKTFLNMSAGVKVEFRVMQDEGEIRDMFYDIGIGALQSEYTRFSTDVAYCSVGLYGKYPNGDESLWNATIFKATPEVLIENASNDFRFHNYLIDYDEFDNVVNFVRDGKLVTALKAQPRPFDELPLCINGLNFHNTNYLDYMFARKRAEVEPICSLGNEQTLKTFALDVKGTIQNVSIVSDSAIDRVSFNQTRNELTFSVFATSNAASFFNVTIPKTLLDAEPPDWWEVTIDNLSSFSTVTRNETHSSLYAEYTLGNHTVTISGSGSVAEFPSFFSYQFLSVASSALIIATAWSRIRRRKDIGIE